METVLSDLRYGLRLLARAPGFTLVTLTALAVGIGANTTIVSVANALLLRPPAVHEPGRVIRIQSNRFSASPLPDAIDYGREVIPLVRKEVAKRERQAVAVGR